MEFTQRADHKTWGTERKNRARDNAERLGRLETLAKTSGAYPVAVAMAVVAALGYVGAVESR